ncbi:MAG TPA: ABC transporter permease [Caulobacteraceae bacterium]|jgi:ABC-2 type transport system permease protein
MMLGFSFRRVGAIAKVESKRLVNDVFLLSIIFVLPVVQTLLYGYAINLNPQHLPLAIASNDRELVQPAVDQIKLSKIVYLTGPVGAPGTAERAVRNGTALIGLEARAPQGTTPLTVTVYADAGDPQTVGHALASIEAGLWRGVARNYAQNYAAETPPDVKTAWVHGAASSPEVPDSWFVTPGLIGNIVMISMLFLGAFTLVRERESGSWETLLAMPVTPMDALMGKLTPYLAIGTLNTVILLVMVKFLFGLPLPPAAWALAAAAPVFAASYLILGFACSALAQNQLQAGQAAVFIYLPSLILSGFLFPFAGMPRWAKIIGEILPLTHYVRASRDVLIRGYGPMSVVTHMEPVLLFTVGATALAVFAYRRRLS